MRQAYLTMLLILSCLVTSLAQTATVQGNIKNKTGEAIPFATVYIKGLQVGQTADQNGYFILENLPSGQWNIAISAVGFQHQVHTIELSDHQNLEIQITLNDDSLLQTVEVFGDRYARPDKIESLTRLPLDTYNQIQSISVISEKLIKNQGALTIAEVAHNVPGVYTFATYGNKRESMSSRGFRGIPILKNGVRVHSDFRGVGILTDMQGINNV